MSGRITKRVPSRRKHECKGQPRMLSRLYSYIGEGSEWTCDECDQVWKLQHFVGWGYEWVKQSN